MSELVEPPKAGAPPLRPFSETAWAKRRAPSIVYPIIGAIPGGVAGMIVGLFFLDTEWIGLIPMAVGALLSSAYTLRHAMAFVCTQCGAALPRDLSICPGCHAMIRGRVTEKDVRRMAEEEMDRRAAADIDYEDCPDCKPEQPCERHPLEVMTPDDF